MVWKLSHLFHGKWAVKIEIPTGRKGDEEYSRQEQITRRLKRHRNHSLQKAIITIVICLPSAMEKNWSVCEGGTRVFRFWWNKTKVRSVIRRERRQIRKKGWSSVRGWREDVWCERQKALRTPTIFLAYKSKSNQNTYSRSSPGCVCDWNKTKSSRGWCMSTVKEWEFWLVNF